MSRQCFGEFDWKYTLITAMLNIISVTILAICLTFDIPPYVKLVIIMLIFVSGSLIIICFISAILVTNWTCCPNVSPTSTTEPEFPNNHVSESEFV